MKIFLLIALVSAILTVVTSKISRVEREASKYVDDICHEKRIRSYEVNVKSWNYESNVTSHNQRIKTQAKEQYAIYTKEIAMSLLQYNYDKFQNATLKRIIKKLVDIDEQILEAKDFREFNEVVARMQGNYAKVKIPSYEDESALVQLEPEITEIFLTSTDPDELKYYWTQWYDRAGTPCKEDFFKYVELKNKAARLNGKSDGI
jgi:peptidyl-dipeptidase A